jgi:lysophospholipase L1-like esterase
MRQTVIFALALTVLFFGAKGGAPTSRVLVLFVVFVITATIWVRGQYVESIRVHPDVTTMPIGIVWSKSLLASLGLSGLGVVLMVVFLFSRWDGLGLAGAILVYFGGGYLVTLWRRGMALTSRWGYMLLVTGLVMAVLGFLLLGHVPNSLNWVSLALILVPALLVLPVGLTLVSEQAIRWMSGPASRARSWRMWTGIGGVVLFAVSTALFAHYAKTSAVVVGMLALALLIVAVVSATQTDIVAILAVLAIMGVTPQQASVPGALSPGGHTDVLVALGDSYMSGEGASIYYKGTDDGGGDQCRRSPTSWAAMAGQLSPFGYLDFLACSGASTDNVMSDSTSPPFPSAQAGEGATQLQRYLDQQKADPFTPGLVVLSIGGNDAGFSTIGIMCIAPGNCDDKKYIWFGGLAEVQQRLELTYANVREVFPHTPVVVTAYPDPIDERVANCGQISLSASERAFITSFLANLNSRIENVAKEYGFYYLGGMAQALANSNLQLCDKLNEGRPGVNFIGLRSVSGVAEQRFNPANWAHSSLHPNERGHAAMLRVFENWLATHWPLSNVAPDLAPATPGEGQPIYPGGPLLQAKPLCDLFDVSPSGCRPEGQTWAEQQVGKAMLTEGWALLPGAFGAWVAAVAFFGWRRKVMSSTAERGKDV